MKNLIIKAKDAVIVSFLFLTGAWLLFALSFQLYGVYLVTTGQDEEMTRITNEISWKIDGTFKDNPENIWYNK